MTVLKNRCQDKEKVDRRVNAYSSHFSFSEFLLHTHARTHARTHQLYADTCILVYTYNVHTYLTCMSAPERVICACTEQGCLWRKVDISVYLFLTLAIYGRERSASLPSRFIPKEEPQCALRRGYIGTRTGLNVSVKTNLSCFTRNRTRIRWSYSPLPSRYIGYGTQTSICMHAYRYILQFHTYVRMYTHTYVHRYIVHTYINTYIHTHKHTRTHAHTIPHTHTHTHTPHTHTHTHPTHTHTPHTPPHTPHATPHTRCAIPYIKGK